MNKCIQLYYKYIGIDFITLGLLLVAIAIVVIPIIGYTLGIGM